MTSSNIPLIRDVSRSWLYFLNIALSGANISFLNQAGSARLDTSLLESSPSGTVIAGPATEWRLTDDKLEAAFQLRIVTRQMNGDGLAAYEQNLTLQLALHNILFSSERYVSGFSTGQGDQYGIPLWTFDESGAPLQEVDAHTITYLNQPHWIARNALEANRVVWTLDLTLKL